MPERISPFRVPTRHDPRDPRASLSFFYTAMFGHMGIVMPFLAPWLQDRGFGPFGIGALLALPPMFKILAPWNWARWADRSGRRRELLAGASLLAAIALSATVFVPHVAAITAMVALYGFCKSPILPYVEATSLEQSEHRNFAYGPIRLWGSLSFMVVSCGFGALGGRVSDDAGLLLAGGLLAVCSVTAFTSFPAPLTAPPADGASAGFGADQASVGVVRLLAACALMQVSHGAYYTFYSIHLEALGYGRAAIGGLWALGVLCEVVLLAGMEPIVRRFGARTVMRVCLVVAAVRWLAIGSVSGPLSLGLAQTLHAATYAGFHVAAIREVFRRFPITERARGQALYSGMTYGLGMFLGSLVAGTLARSLGLPAVFTLSAVVALAALPLLGRNGRAESA